MASPLNVQKWSIFRGFFAIWLRLPWFSATVFLKKPVFLTVSHVERDGIHGLRSWGRNWSRKVRETPSSSSRKRPERGQEVLAAR